MSLTLAFDVYGTLIDTHGVVAALEKLVGEQAGRFSNTWREKQLEYAFRRGLMRAYADFGVCTSQALDHTCESYGLVFSAEQKKTLLESYSTLPAFDDVIEGLAALQSSGDQLFAFSNGRAEAVDQLLVNAGVRGYFTGIVSCDEVRTFKPDPEVYAHFLQVAQTTAAETWLVSSNPFDVIGAVSAGWRAAWVKRSASAVFDPWGMEPTLTVSDLGELKQALAG